MSKARRMYKALEIPVTYYIYVACRTAHRAVGLQRCWISGSNLVINTINDLISLHLRETLVMSDAPVPSLSLSRVFIMGRFIDEIGRKTSRSQQISIPIKSSFSPHKKCASNERKRERVYSLINRHQSNEKRTIAISVQEKKQRVCVCVSIQTD